MSETGTLFFYFDYVDPLSFILMRRLQESETARDLPTELVPLEMNLPSGPLLDPEGGEYLALWDATSAQNLENPEPLRRPWIVPWSRKAHELAFHAREMGSFQAIHEAIFRAYLIESRDIGRIDVLVEIAGEAGLDRRETKAVLDVDRFRGAVEEARIQALARGCTSPPTLLWKDMKIIGDPSPEALNRFLASGADDDTT